MQFNRKKLSLSSALLFSLPLACSSIFAAQAINLNKEPLKFLQSFHTVAPAVTIKETGRDVDFKKKLHVRIQEMYQGYLVYGGAAIMHAPQGDKNASVDELIARSSSADTMNGIFYQGIEKDLAHTSAHALSSSQSQKMQDLALATFKNKSGAGFALSDVKAEKIVFVDAGKKAHWAYHISFYAKPSRSSIKPEKPNYIIDAVTGHIYHEWDNIQTIKDAPTVQGGGFGGNLKMGELVYDGLQKDLAALSMERSKGGLCTLQNNDVQVYDFNTEQLMSFKCKAVNPKHNEYWDADFDKVNGGYSPANDALSAGIVIKNMYQDWYGIPVLKNRDGSDMMLEMVVHEREYDNAYWDGHRMTFGDGADIFYPLTSLGVGAHEISHGFTQQHSNLEYFEQSGGMNEAFSDMAAQAAELYSYGKNSWQIGPEIFKAPNEALRYMDQPSKDCHGSNPGDWCSIDDESEYYNGLDVHFSSGVYNHFFYALGTTQGWDAKKAFDVMVHANAHYWTPYETFDSGACGVISAAKDLGYSVDDVKSAFDVVKVDYSAC